MGAVGAGERFIENDLLCCRILEIMDKLEIKRLRERFITGDINMATLLDYLLAMDENEQNQFMKKQKVRFLFLIFLLNECRKDPHNFFYRDLFFKFFLF